MVDQLVETEPHIFESPDKTFVDFYMKSGLYITEIVKRLYRNKVLKSIIPDDKERVKHILECQVFGFAPTQIIYDITMSYIFGLMKGQITSAVVTSSARIRCLMQKEASYKS